MLKAITWGEYMHFFAILIPVYYAVVLALYFRSDISRLLSKGFGKGRRTSQPDDPGSIS